MISIDNRQCPRKYSCFQIHKRIGCTLWVERLQFTIHGTMYLLVPELVVLLFQLTTVSVLKNTAVFKIGCALGGEITAHYRRHNVPLSARTRRPFIQACSLLCSSALCWSKIFPALTFRPLFPFQVSSSECSRDQPSIVFEDQLETEEECVTLCQTYASISVIGCTFAAWEAGVVLGKCTLYKEPFANYLAHCQLLAGPPDVSGCSVDHPAENSCDGIRFLCIFLFCSLWFLVKPYLDKASVFCRAMFQRSLNQ